MTFHHPQVLWLLLVLMPLLWLWRIVRRHRERRLAAFAARETWPVLNASVSARARWWKSALFTAALCFAIIAAARPMWGTRERLIHERGIDIIVAMDVSRSMLVSDIEPNRLEQSKRRFRELLARFPGQRIGIMPFAGEPFLQVPLTNDYGLALRMLEAMDTNTIGTQGTNIAGAIARAREAFREGGIGSSVLLLITDGENHEGEVLEEARLAAEEGIKIFTLGIGSPEGAPVVLPDGKIMEDEAGHKVMSRLDAATLREIAEITGGEAFVARPGESIDIQPLVDRLSKLEQGEAEGAGTSRLVREERYQFPLAIALALFFIEGLIGDRRRVIARKGAAA